MKGFFYRNWEEPTYLGPLVLIRVFCGYYFLSAATFKFINPSLYGPPAYAKMIQEAAAINPSPWYQAFLTNWVLPNIDLFRFLNIFGEFAMGLALVLGLFTRLAALVGILAVYNYWSTLGVRGATPIAPGTPQITKLFIFGLSAVFLTSAGRSFGIDRWLHQKFPRNPLF